MFAFVMATILAHGNLHVRVHEALRMQTPQGKGNGCSERTSKHYYNAQENLFATAG